MTAVGAKFLARKNSKVLGHIGARGSSYWNVRLLDHLFNFDEIRVHSRRPESRDAFGAKLERDLGKNPQETFNRQMHWRRVDMHRSTELRKASVSQSIARKRAQRSWPARA